jgi:hypothetical protein
VAFALALAQGRDEGDENADGSHHGKRLGEKKTVFGQHFHVG